MAAVYPLRWQMASGWQCRTGATHPMLSLWGMPANGHPSQARSHQTLSIELQGDDGGPSNGRLADDFGSIGRPGKMLLPALGTGMKQWNDCSTVGIARLHLIAFVLVAFGVGQPEVGLYRCASGCFRDDVVYIQFSPMLSCLS